MAMNRAAARRCAVHQQRPAFAVCMQCAKTLCQECATQWDGIWYCAACLGTRRSAPAANVARRRMDRRDRRIAGHPFLQHALHGLERRAARGTPLIRAPLSTTSVLDESAAVVRATVSPWAALLLATSIPYRFMQIVFADRLIELGSKRIAVRRPPSHDRRHHLRGVSPLALGPRRFTRAPAGWRRNPAPLPDAKRCAFR